MTETVLTECKLWLLRRVSFRVPWYWVLRGKSCADWARENILAFPLYVCACVCAWVCVCVRDCVNTHLSHCGCSLIGVPITMCACAIIYRWAHNSRQKNIPSLKNELNYYSFYASMQKYDSVRLGYRIVMLKQKIFAPIFIKLPLQWHMISKDDI